MFDNPAIILLLTLPLLGYAIREVRQSQFTLLEAIIATAIMGNAVALPIMLAWRTHSFTDRGPARMIVAATVGITIALTMAYGTPWVFRRLRAINEQRPHVRIFYMLLGMFSFSTILIPPLAYLVWRPLIALHRKARAADPSVPEIEILAPINLSKK